MVIIVSGVIFVVAVALSLGWYFSPSNRAKRAPYWIRMVTDEQRAALKAAGLKFDSGGRPDPDSIWIKKKLVDEACRIMNVYVLGKRNIPRSKYTELVIRPIVPQNPAHNGLQIRMICNLNETPDMRDKSIGLIREIVLPVVNMHINVYDLNTNVNEPGNEDEFHIFLNSAPRSNGRVNVPNSILGVELDNPETAFKPAFAGVPLTDPASNFVFGEVVGKSLYIFFDALPNCDEKLILFAKILENAAPELDVDGVLEEALATIPPLPAGRAVQSNRRRRVVQFGFKLHRRETATALVREILLPAVNCEVYLRDCRGTPQQPADDGSFHILYNSRPVAALGEAGTPSGLGIPIMSAGKFVGELIDRNCYLFADELGYAARQDVKRFAQVLQRVRDQVVVWEAVNGSDLVDDQFIEECLGQVRARMLETADLGAVDAQFNAASEELTKILKVAQQAERDVIQLDAFPEEALAREYDSLLNIKKVIGVNVTNSKIVVETDTLYCEDPQTRVVHRIGEFDIHIPMNAHEYIRFLRKGGLVHGMNAPHVSDGGHACLGNTQDLFPELIRKREFASAVQLAIAFLESVNKDDPWGRRIEQWPVARRAGDTTPLPQGRRTARAAPARRTYTAGAETAEIPGRANGPVMPWPRGNAGNDRNTRPPQQRGPDGRFRARDDDDFPPPRTPRGRTRMFFL